MSGVEVRLRHEYEDKGRVLGEISLERLDWLIAEIGRWGVAVEGEDEMMGHDNISAQFRLDRTAAYFDVVLSPEES